MYLKISPMKGVVRFCKIGKVSPRYVGPYEIFQRVCKVIYELRLPSELALVHPIFHLSMLKKFIGDPSLFLLLKVLMSRIISLMRKFWFKFLIGKSRSQGLKRWFP